jgi:hypothetical protein
MILERKIQRFEDFNDDSYITTERLLNLLEDTSEFKDDLIKLFQINQDIPKIISIGNANFLLDSLTQVDDSCEKIDINVAVKDIQLVKMLDAEKAIFEIFTIDHKDIIKKIKSDRLEVETVYFGVYVPPISVMLCH